MDNKEQLVEAINCKYPRNNLIELYYNTGRALPFTAQRFPDGRVSDWYRNQYVQVVKVEPGGRYGKYGKVYGFYYRNGERADAWENDPENSWCTKEEVDPQEIPNSGCGGWVLLDIQGEPTQENLKLLELEDQFDFGKYKGKTIKEVIELDWQYVKWAVIDSQNLIANVDDIIKYHDSILKPLLPDSIISFGKYKGRTIGDIFKNDPQYLKWMQQNNSDFRIDWEVFSKDG